MVDDRRVAGIRLLGPLEVEGARPLEPRDRVVLCVLAVRRGQVVSPGQIADAVWGDEPPRSWAKQVQICIGRLRKAVGPEAIETTAGGYRLTVDGEDLDADRFSRLVERGAFLAASGDPYRAEASYARALSMWRGTPLDDLDGWDPGRCEVARYQELRRSAEEGWLDARLAAGDHRAVAAEAAALADEEPLRERRWAILAVALYRCSRQADALRALARAREVLVDQVGVDPGPELASLEAEILRQDPALDASLEARSGVETCPYKGLASYEEADAEEFFGREAEIEACLDRLDATPLLVIAGPSGCGKSSLLRAGVVPALRRRGRDVIVLVPGPDPRAALTALPRSPGTRPVVVVDQFEELFALDHPDAVVGEVCERLAEHARHGGVIIGLRSDHIGSLGANGDLRRLAERGLHLVSPLDGDDLRAAIRQPAVLASLHLESGLVELLVRDCEGEAGALPLLSHALVETWRRREANTLTVDGYRSTGGIRGAVARSADLLYDGLTAEQRDTLRSILLRLITPSIEGDPVRTRVPSRSLLGSPGRERVVAMLIRARLVTAHDESFELSHEALARAWPRLQGWLDDDVNGQRVFRHLVMAADGWDSFGRADGELYRGARLESALEWRATTSAELSDVEVAFLDASGELDVSQRRALAERADRETRQNRRLRTLVSVVAGVMVAAVVVGAVAVDQADRATTESRVSATRELTAASAANLGADPERSVLLALAALERTGSEDGPEAWAAEDALHRALTASRIERQLPGVGERVDWSSRGDVLAAIGPSGTGAVEIRDMATGESRHVIDTDGSEPSDVAFDATGNLLGITSEDGSVRVVDPATGITLHTLPRGDGSRAAGPSFSADGSLFAAAWPEEAGGLVRVLSLRTSDVREVRSLPGAQATSFAPEGTRLAVAMSDEAASRVIDVETGETVLRLAGHTPGSFGVSGVAWSPDGRAIATSADDGSARVFDAATGTQRIVIPGHGAFVSAVDWSPDSVRLATSSSDGTARIWSLLEGGPRELATLSAQYTRKGVTDISFSPDGTRLVTAERSRSSAIIWNVGLDGGAEVGNLPSVAFHYNAARFSQEGRYLFTTGAGGSVEVWNARTLAPVRTLGGRASPAAPASAIPGVAIGAVDDVSHIAPTSDGSLVATLNDQAGVSGEGVVPVWDVATGDKLFTAGVGTFANHAEWSPDGQVLAIAGGDADGGSVTMVDRSGRTIQVIPVPGLLVGSLAFMPDGEQLVGTVEALGPYDPAAGRLIVWQWRTGTEVISIDTEAWYAVPGATGEVIVTAPHQQAESQDLTVWSAESGEAVTTLTGHSGSVNFLALDRSETRIATAGGDGTVQIWDATTGESLLALHGHIGATTYVSFDAEGSRLASTGVDGTVRIWELDRAELVRIAEARLTRGLTDDECREFLHADRCDPG